MKRLLPSWRAGAALAAFLLAAPRPPAPPALAAAEHEPARAAALPAIVFVSRAASGAGEIPGLGPHGRALAPGGRLMIRDSAGVVRELIPAGRLFDVSDPAVSWDARAVAFAGKAAPESAWRIYLADLDGSQWHALTHSDPAPDLSWAGAAAGAALAGADDLDPCWIGAHRLAFVSTRWPLISEYGGVRTTNLYALDVDGGAPRRLTTERNGVAEPVYDPATGRILFSRWWFNRYRASNLDVAGLTTLAERAIPADSVNLWQLVSFDPALHDTRLVAGDPRVRAAAMGDQPAILPDGRIVAVFARHLGLSPTAGAVGLEVFGSRPGRDTAGARSTSGGVPFTIAAPRRLIGPAGAATADPYHEASGLAAPQACSPAALPDGRIVFAYDPGARGDFGLYVMRADGSDLRPLVDLPGTLELDPAPVVRRAWHERAFDLEGAALNAPQPPHEVPASPGPGQPSFRFHCLDLFANAPTGAPIPRAPRPAADLTVRFFAALSRPQAIGADTVVLLRTAAVSPRGEIDVSGLPVDVPMFEQVVDSRGRVLMSESGPAHVAGFNASAPGERRCVGCHVGHSAIPVRGGTGARTP